MFSNGWWMKYLSKEKLKKIKIAWEKKKKIKGNLRCPPKLCSCIQGLPHKRKDKTAEVSGRQVFSLQGELENNYSACWTWSHVWKEITVPSFTVCHSFSMAWVSFKSIPVRSLTLSINFRCLSSALPLLLPFLICHYLPSPGYFISILLLVDYPITCPVHPLLCSYSSMLSFTCRQGHSGPLKQRSPIFYSVHSRLFSVILPVPSVQIACLILSSFMSSRVSWRWSIYHFLDRKVSFLPLPFVHIVPF